VVSQQIHTAIGGERRLETAGGYLGEDDIVRFEDLYKRS